MPTKLTPDIIAAAIDGYESRKTRIDAKIAELRAMRDGGSAQSATTSEPVKRKRRKMSAASRARIAEAQRNRWAASRQAAEPAAAQQAPQRKRRLSAAGRKAIIAATKKRWALKRAEAAKAQPAKTKKPH